MAHSNIRERQAHVRELISRGVKINAAKKREIAEQYGCSATAVYADIVAITRPKTDDTPFQSASTRRKIFDRDGRICQYCADTNAYEYIVEHVIPAAIGGVARPYNLVIACQRCNTKKRRQVWIPANLDAITSDHPEWREKVLMLSGEALDALVRGGSK